MKILSNKYFKNSVWLIIDKLFVLGGGLIATTLVAKYLGPEQFGILSYGLTLSLFITAVAQWGANYVIFNLAAKDRKKSELIIHKTMTYRIVVYLLLSIIVSVVLHIKLDYEDAKVISAICFCNLFLSLDIYQYYFNGSLSSQLNTKITLIAKVSSILSKVCLVVIGVDLVVFTLPILLEGIIVFVLKKRRFSNISKLSNFVVDKSFSTRKYFYEGFPYVASSFLVLAYTKSNELFLQELTSFSELGVFTAGMLLSNAWVFVPIAVGTSLLTKAISSGDNSDYAFTYFSTALISIPIILLLYFFRNEVILLTFGSEYMKLSTILPILSIGSLFSVFVFLINRQISNYEGGGGYLIKKTGATAAISISFSYLLISIYGVNGAVLTWVITQFFGVSLGNIWFKKIKWLDIAYKFLSVKEMIVILRKL
ncbi:oligosaccharide flippase family protein [Vibrio campbellii]|uniref:oligosaccharide flippase family protein n=1 Tax=Vibrio campbellii TaxID=680 RepID=UPI0018B02CFB|nr:oligosaccharide flippase family protein [Vibrio campbellii]